MGPDKSLPHGDEIINTEDYVSSLLNFATRNELFRTLCGGIHILDFMTATPDLYSRVLPAEWRLFFQAHDMMAILDLLMREDLHRFSTCNVEHETWREGPVPPATLLQYIREVRIYLLVREPQSSQCSRNRAMKPTQKLARNVAVGMNVKKVHEVGLFANYVDGLTHEVSSARGEQISHLVDFGSGQNYLGRALASEPYGRNVVAVESKHHNVEGARSYDVTAKLAKKQLVMRNKKAFRAGLHESGTTSPSLTQPLTTPPSEVECDDCQSAASVPESKTRAMPVQISAEGRGTVQYIEHRIQDGNLSDVISKVVDSDEARTQASDRSPQSDPGFLSASVDPDVDVENPRKHTTKTVMTISLHSCGNLVHHGLRSLILNPSVKAVALVGCCYNLITERLVPSTYKLPELRPTAHPRLEKTGKACDANGFPMSSRLCEQLNPDNSRGVSLNITARMMAVQAPQNWGEKDSNDFFTRHFFRALLQRILLDRGVVNPPSGSHAEGASVSPAGHTSDTPVIIGSLRKSCYASFVNYVHAAREKLYDDPDRGDIFRDRLSNLSDEEIEHYECTFAEKKKELSVIWSLMAFSAGVVEAVIVVDRWLWLTEQKEVTHAWAEAVFDYRISPRNIVVVGVKK